MNKDQAREIVAAIEELFDVGPADIGSPDLGKARQRLTVALVAATEPPVLHEVG